MDFTVEKIEDLQYKAIIDLDWSEVEPDYNRLLVEYSKNGIPGFRPNKITPKAIEARYGRKIKNDLLEDVPNRFLHEVIQAKELYPCGVDNIDIIEYNKGTSIKLEATIIQPIKFELTDYSKIEVPKDCDNIDDFKDVISAKLSDGLDFEIPQSMIDMEIKMSNETGENEPLDVIVDRTRLLILLKEIALTEGVETSEAEFDKNIQEMADDYNITADRLKDFLVTTNGLHRVKLFQIGEDTIDYLAEKNFKKE
jgi:FKBP-type peptidyl-prolyl cis-trans isomerase (trigger factor)